MNMSSVHLPVEILYNILGRLSVKEIIRLRCVCKTWRDLVVDPSFVSKQLDLYPDDSRYLLHYRTGDKQVFSVFEERTFSRHSKPEVPFSLDSLFFKLAGSVDGLLCLSPSFEKFGRTLYLCNPTIGKLKILRRTCFRPLKQFKKRGPFFALGFGCHQRTKDYKIVRIMHFKEIFKSYVEKKPPKAEVFSLKRNSWKKIECYAGCYANGDCSTVVVNDRVHWMGFRPKDDSFVFVLTFDLGLETFGEIMLPKYLDERNSKHLNFGPSLSLGVLRESLALFVCSYETPGQIEYSDVWLMGEYGMDESWSKQYSIVPSTGCFRCLGIVNRELMFDTNKQMKQGLLSYDFDRDQLEEKSLGFDFIHSLATFRESLVLYKEGFCLTPRKNVLAEAGSHLGKRKRSVFKLLQKKWL